MEIEITTSKYMDESENKTIRIPAICREKYDIELYEFISLRDKNNQLLTLQVVGAYKDDLTTERPTAFVTDKVYSELHFVNSNHQEVKRFKGIMLGCDPEFFLIDDNTNDIVSAEKFVQKYDDVGYDGLMMEIRPLPSTGVDGLMTNISNLFSKARAAINKKPGGENISMRAASCYRPGVTAGFHLHYGLPPKLLGKSYDLETITRLMVMVSDYYVGIPSVISEGKDDVLRRTVPYLQYGKPGGYVLDHRTLEYRLPGGYLLRHPLLSSGLISLGITVIEDLVSRINVCTDQFSKLDELKTIEDINQMYPNLPTIETLYNCICNEDDSPARRQLNTIITDVRKMVGYKEREQYLEPLFIALMEETKFNDSIEKNWRIHYAK